MKFTPNMRLAAYLISTAINFGALAYISNNTDDEVELVLFMLPFLIAHVLIVIGGIMYANKYEKREKYI